MVAVLSCIIGWSVHLYGVNQALDSHSFRYHILRMELGYTQPNITSLDSLFSAEDSDDSIRKLRSRVTNYELAVERQAELHLPTITSLPRVRSPYSTNETLKQ